MPMSRSKRVARKYNSKVLPRSFVAGDLVLRRIHRNGSTGKLGANWEGPFRIKEEIGKGAFRLEELGGRSIPRTWNCSSLRFYFS